MLRKTILFTPKASRLLKRDVLMRVAVENKMINKTELDKEKIFWL